MRYFISVILLLSSLSLFAEEASSPSYINKYIEGIDYQVLEPAVKTLNKDKIEVTEAFSYLCGHCYTFEPTLNKWAAGLADDVELVKLPVVFQRNMQHYSRIYYSAKALKISEQVSAEVFRSIHIQRNQLKSAKQVTPIFEKLGVSAEDFNKTFKSFGVDSQVRQAASRTRALKVAGTPQMFVEGRYSISVKKGIGHKEMLQIVDFLVAKVRAEK